MATSEPPLRLVIRFSNSTPDLPLDVPRPSTTTVASLKSTLRGAVPALARRRLRFIHRGRILPDADPLLGALDPSRKGKFPLHARIFLNCSIGDDLLDEDLASEVRIASRPARWRRFDGDDDHDNDGVGGDDVSARGGGGAAPSSSSAPPPPRRERETGFDRLLSAGFSAAEVNQLRLQFRSIHASRHTPDTMPSAEALRAMEDAWMDSNGPSAPSEDDDLAGAGGGGGAGALLDTFLEGLATGFFLPLGSLVWLLREEGMWSKRRQVAVVFGVLVGVVSGLLKLISGEEA